MFAAALRPRRPPALHNILTKTYSTASPLTTVPLSFTRYDPPTRDGAPPGDTPMVIMHGLFGSKQNNRSISRALAQATSNKVFALDLRNHGDSPHIDTHTYEHMAADVEAFLLEHSLGPNTVLIGHSMGAKAAMAVSLRRPSLVGKLIVVDNAPVEALLHSSFGNYVRAMRKIEDAAITRKEDADRILQEVEPALEVRQFLMTNLVRREQEGGGMVLKWRVPLRTLARSLDAMGGFPFHPDKVRFEKPALFVRGTKSHYVPDEVMPVIGRFFPLFRMKDIEAGHWVIAEKPHEFKDAVIEFLNATDEK